MTLEVCRNQSTGAWILRRIDGRNVPMTLGTYRGRKAALTAARLLAGWRGTIRVEA